MKVIQLFDSLTSHSRVRVFIIDDSVLRRDRSKKAELLVRIFDHTTVRYTRGYNMLTLGWSDGYMLSSAKLANRFYEMKERLSKRTQGYKRRMEALSRKPDAVVALLDRAGQTNDEQVNALISWIRELNKEMGIPNTLREYGASEEMFTAHVDEMAVNAVQDPCTSTNPRETSVEEMKKLYVVAFYGQDKEDYDRKPELKNLLLALPTNLLQAQRDTSVHTPKRVDKEGIFHTN